MMYDHYGPMSAGDWLFGSIMMLVWLLFLGLIIVFVARAFRSSNDSQWHSHSPDPLDTIKNRYAKGEITKEQYEQLKKDLK